MMTVSGPMKDRTMKKLFSIQNLSALLVFLIAASAFVLSFNSIRALAIDNGTDPALAWLVPVIVDLAMVGFSVAALNSTLNKESTWFKWILIFAFTAVSVGFNVAHSNLMLMGIVIAAMAPLTLFFSFEVFISGISASVKRNSVLLSLVDIQKLVAKLNSRRDQLVSTIEQLTEQKRIDIEQATNEIGEAAEQLKNKLAEDIEQLHDRKRLLQNEISKIDKERMPINHVRLLALAEARPDATYRQLGSFVGVAPGTVGGYVKELTESGHLHKNGSGWEVTP